MFSTHDDDEFFNGTANASNLASLFGSSLTAKQNENTSLVYSAPKNPKIHIEEASKSTSTLQNSVICSAFVDTYLLTAPKRRTSHGKCGFAIIGNKTIKAFDLIIYKSKQDIIMRKKLNIDFAFTVKVDNFVSFIDDEKRQWFVHFDNFKEIQIFSDEIKNIGATVLNYSFSNEEWKGENENVIPRDSPDTNSDSSQNKSKASILSRMAKMGQPILPTNPQIKSTVTDSETDEAETLKRPTVKKRHKIGAVNIGDVASKSNNQIANTSEYIVVNGQLLPVAALPSGPPMLLPNQLAMTSSQLTPTQYSIPSDPFNIFIAENRTHNCELRMNMTHLSSKLDTILSKIDKSSTKDDSNELLQTISDKDVELNKKQRMIEALQIQYNTLNENNDQYQDTVSNLQQQIDIQKQEINGQIKKSEELTTLLNEATSLKEKHLKSITTLNDTIAKLNTEVSAFNNSDYDAKTEKLNALQDEIKSRNVKADAFAKTLKHSMNQLYQEILGNFDEQLSYSGSQVKAVLLQKLKTSTLGIIQEFNKNFKDTPENSNNTDLHSSFLDGHA